ncbi:hypothetical protein EYR41_011545 [Orbilia oligospora]|uniref:Uncharacterized protein n=1 Tax=Orbilia oligospora TaxID=2813651 RepID=A0A8H2HN79_ORBOL|nr:hypothetical protein EYR41_011545 [Orbilia oligospora]
MYFPSRRSNRFLISSLNRGRKGLSIPSSNEKSGRTPSFLPFLETVAHRKEKEKTGYSGELSKRLRRGLILSIIKLRRIWYSSGMGVMKIPHSEFCGEKAKGGRR